MGRTLGVGTKKNCWKVSVILDDKVLHSKEYSTLKVAGDELGLTYAQMFELGPKGRKKKCKNTFKYTPDIIVEKIGAIKPVPTVQPVSLEDLIEEEKQQDEKQQEE